MNREREAAGLAPEHDSGGLGHLRFLSPEPQALEAGVPWTGPTEGAGGQRAGTDPRQWGLWLCLWRSPPSELLEGSHRASLTFVTVVSTSAPGTSETQFAQGQVAGTCTHTHRWSGTLPGSTLPWVTGDPNTRRQSRQDVPAGP